jgi:DnaK suppressor protein
VSKSPAKKVAPKKAVAPKKPASAAKAPSKAAAPAKKAAAKTAPKSSAKPAKPAPATHNKVAAKAAAKVATPKAPTKPAVAAAHNPAPKTMPKAPAPAAAAAPPVAVATPAAAVAKPAPAPSGRRSSKAAAYVQVQAPLPPPTSRFADRFAPPRPPTRQMNNLGLDVLKPSHKADPKLASAWKTKAGRDLTEAEVLAMPEAEYMNEKQLEFFRVKLQTLKDDLLSNAGETTEHLREDTSIVPDPADRATIEEEHALELRTRDRERKLLKKISQSLGRIESGDYGFCDETGEPIGLGRLIARPTATLSLEAQQRRELKQKMFGD